MLIFSTFYCAKTRVNLCSAFKNIMSRGLKPFLDKIYDFLCFLKFSPKLNFFLKIFPKFFWKENCWRGHKTYFKQVWKCRGNLRRCSGLPCTCRGRVCHCTHYPPVQTLLGENLGKNYLILERSVGETFMNPWKNIYPCAETSMYNE